MDQTTKDKLAINAGNALKMASNYVIVGASAVATAYLALPVTCPDAGAVVGSCVSQHAIQAWIIAALHVPPLLVPIVVGAAGVLARLWPQKSISAPVAAAKSTEPGATVPASLSLRDPLAPATVPPPQ